MLQTDPDIERLIRASNRSLSRERELRKQVTRLEAALVETHRLQLAEPNSILATAILDALPETVLVLNATGAFTYVNHAAIKLLGYPRDEFLALFVTDIVSGHREWAVKEFSRFVNQGFWLGEVTLKRKDGATVKGDARAVALPGEVYVGIFREAPV